MWMVCSRFSHSVAIAKNSKVLQIREVSRPLSLLGVLKVRAQGEIAQEQRGEKPGQIRLLEEANWTWKDKNENLSLLGPKDRFWRRSFPRESTIACVK